MFPVTEEPGTLVGRDIFHLQPLPVETELDGSCCFLLVCVFVCWGPLIRDLIRNVFDTVAHILVKVLIKTGQPNCGLLSSVDVLQNTLMSHRTSIEDNRRLCGDLGNQAATDTVSTVPAVLIEAYQVIAEIACPLYGQIRPATG